MKKKHKYKNICDIKNKFKMFKFISNLLGSAMNKLAELLTDFSLNMDKKCLQEQLIDFDGKWDSLSKTLPEDYICIALDLEKVEESGLTEEHYINKKTCKNCVFCCYQILWKYNLNAKTYTEPKLSSTSKKDSYRI